MHKSTGKKGKRQESRDLEDLCWVYLKPLLEEGNYIRGWRSSDSEDPAGSGAGDPDAPSSE